MNSVSKFGLALLCLLLDTACIAADLVILAPPDLLGAWEYYAAQRRLQRPDLEIEVVGTDAVYAMHPFGAALPCRTAAESVHAFIRAQAKSGTPGFLLGGMWLDVRDQSAETFFLTGERLSLSNCVPGVSVSPYAGAPGGAIPSDMYYACLDDVSNGLDYPWDPDGDGVYLGNGEIGSCDRVPDVVVGRFAAVPFTYGGGHLLTPSQLVTNYAAKVARGESPSFTGTRTVGVASAQMTQCCPCGSTALGRTRRDIGFFDEVPNMWSPLHGSPVADSEYATRETLQTLIAPHWPLERIESLHATGRFHARRYADFAAARSAWFAAEMVYAICRSHGSSMSAAVDGTAWLTRDLYASAAGLTLFADFCVPCGAGSLQVLRTQENRCVVEPGLGVAAVCSPYGGAVVGVFNSGRGWTEAFDSMALADGYSGNISRQMILRLFGQERPTFARAHLSARQDYARQYVMEGERLYTLCEQMFYGDPTVRMPAVERSRVLDPAAVQRATLVSAELPPAGDVVLTGQLKLMEQLTVPGTNLTLAVTGGVGRALVFTGTVPGHVALTGESACSINGLSNCCSVSVVGGGKTVDAGGTGTALTAFSVDGAGSASANVLRCVTAGRLANLQPILVCDSTLALETVEAFGRRTDPLAVVTNGTVILASSPLAGWPDATEHLARPLLLHDAALQIDPFGTFFFGARSGGLLNPWELNVSGDCRVMPVSTNVAAVGLVGRTTVRLEENARLDWEIAVTNADSGVLAFAGDGCVHVTRASGLAGAVEVGPGTALELAEIPCAAVTSLVVRADATLRVPMSVSGLHPLVAPGGRVLLESGASVQDLDGRILIGAVADTTFFEASAALRWKGGAGVWSDARGWYDFVTGTCGAWRNGCTAVFDGTAGSVVTNDLPDVAVDGFVFVSDTEIAGTRGLRCETPYQTVPEGVSVTLSAPVALTGLVKLGRGDFRMSGAQPVLQGALSVDEGRLTLQDLEASGVTNLSAQAGAELALAGRVVLGHAAARGSIASNSLVVAEADTPARLELDVFTPSYRQVVPSGLTVVTRPPDLGGVRWTATVDGRVECTDVLALAYGVVDGTGTLRVPGLLSRCYTSMAKFRRCRLELVPPESGLFPVWGKGIYSSHYGCFSFDGVTFAPEGGVTLTGKGFEKSRAMLYLEEGGVVFDTASGSVVLGDGDSDILFGGPGPVTKIGAGEVRFTSIADLHEGWTDIQGGIYAVESYTCATGFRVTGTNSTLELAVPECRGDVHLGAGTVLDLSDEVATWMAMTNFTAAAGARVRLAVSADGTDVIDVRGGDMALPVDGVVALTVDVLSGTRSGRYPFLVADAIDDAQRAALRIQVGAPAGSRASVMRAADRTCLFLDYRAPGTVLSIR